MSDEQPVDLLPPIIANETCEQECGASTVAVIQRGKIGYVEFLHRTLCAGWAVFFGGRKTMYFGRQGILRISPAADDVHSEIRPIRG